MLVVLVGLFNVWAAVVAWSADGGGARYTAPQLIAAAMVGLGLYQRRSPRATLLILGGAAIPIAVFPWMAPIFVPAFLLVCALVLTTEAGRRDPAAAA